MVSPSSLNIYKTYSKYFKLRQSTEDVESIIQKIAPFFSDNVEISFQNPETKKLVKLVGMDVVLNQLKAQMPQGYTLIKKKAKFSNEFAEAHTLYQAESGERIISSEVYTVSKVDESYLITKITSVLRACSPQ